MTKQAIDPGTLAALFVAAVWGLSFVAASMVLETLSPVLLATLRFILASVLFSPVLIRGRLKGNIPTRNDLKDMALLGVLSISIYFWLQYTGVQYAGAGVSAIIVVGFIPILTGLASSVILKEPFDRRRLLGVSLGFTGVVLITYPNLMLGTVNTRFFIGIACLLGNAICFSLYSTLSRRLLKKYSEPAMVTSYVTVFGTVALIPMSLTSDWSTIWTLTSNQWIAVFFLASICSGLAYFLWNYALSRIDSVEAAVWLYLEPVVAFIGVYLLYGTIPDVLTLLGGVLVLAGAALTSLQKTEVK
ncbi:MAG: EamA family transporter [Candidatus Bathyarchaeota archaeon]|nr:EamA family transporter [Candidatus Bathyarchaeota archaeon]